MQHILAPLDTLRYKTFKIRYMSIDDLAFKGSLKPNSSTCSHGKQQARYKRGPCMFHKIGALALSTI